MAHKTEYLSFFIVLPNAAQAAALQAQFPNGIYDAPLTAATTYAAPYVAPNDPHGPGAYVWSPFGLNLHGPFGLNLIFPLDVPAFSRHSGGFFGIGGTTTTFIWRGYFSVGGDLSPTINGAVPASYATVTNRRWAIGFEGGGEDAGTTANHANVHARDASRHLGQRGYAMRGQSDTYTVNVNALIAGFTTASSWERFYIRVRNPDPLKSVSFWRCKGTTQPAAGLQMFMTPGGQVAIASVDSLSAVTVLGMFDVPAWPAYSKMDILHRWNSGGAGGTGTVTVYINGVSVFTQDITPAQGGIGVNLSGHAQSLLGNTDGVAHTCELDFDDWICADRPDAAFTAKDWLYGSKVTAVRPTGFGTSHANWTGDFRVLLQEQLSLAGSTLTSSVGSAHLAAKTDSDTAVDADNGGMGIASFTVWMRSARGAGSGTLGYSIAGAAEVMAAITQSASSDANAVLVSTPTLPISLHPFELRHAKGAAADAATVSVLEANVEQIGIFGPEDIRATETGGAPIPTFPARIGQHNAPYIRSPWAVPGGGSPLSPIIINGGVYVGNGTGLNLTFKAPIHWIRVRPLTGGTGGWTWYSTLATAHRQDLQGAEPMHMVRAIRNTAFTPAGGGDDQQQEEYWVHIAGNNTQSNAVGVSYQYVAVSDPGARFMENGACQHDTSGTSRTSVDNLLENTTFTPQFAFLFGENVSNNATNMLGVKSEGSAALSYSKLAGTTVANAVALATGKVTTYSALHAAANVAFLAFSAWRRSDGNADPGEANIAAYGSWTGDGAASRTVAFSPTSTKRPLYAIVVPENAIGIIRDPSHTGTTSETTAGGANAATGITAGGINSMTVGSILNSNGVVYHYFVLFGSDTAGNGGWSINGEFTPVEAQSPANGPYVPLVAPAVPSTTPPVTAPIGAGTQFSTVCAPYTTEIINIALARIGNTRQIPNAATDVTQEAFTARLIYGLDLGIVLRDFDWPFATGYAALVLVAGTSTVPVNDDWQYAYRAPTDMVKARRLVSQAEAKRAYDPAPATFRVGSDATGGLIYSDADIATLPLSLEYTALLPCGAASGDYLFRDALAWKVAHSLAGSLSRDVKIVTYCWQMYQLALRNATPVAANESQQEPQGDAPWMSDRWS